MKAYRRMVPVLIVSVILIIQSLALASQTHVTSGSGGTDSLQSHPYNPAHIFLRVGADHTGNVTSGGRMHDYSDFNKNGTIEVSEYYLPHNGDWAMDINLLGTSKLYVDFAGYYTGGVGIDYSKPVRVYAVAGSKATTGGNACWYQSFDVKVDFTDLSAVVHSGSTAAWVGTVWVNHLTFSQPQGAILETPSAKTPTESGGTIQRIDGVVIGTVYNGSGACSNGPHSHMEFVSTHNYGMAYEWHSKDSPPGPDAYKNMPPVSDHVHQGTGTYSDGGDAVVIGQIVGHLGGAATSFWMQDNPNSLNH